MERWFVQKAEIDLRPGGAIRLEWAPEAVERGTILAVEPHHRLSYNWVALEPIPTTLIFELIPENGDTRLRLHHTETTWLCWRESDALRLFIQRAE